MARQPKWTKGPWELSGISLNDGTISIRHAEYRIVIAYATNAASLGDFVSAAIKGRRDFGAPDTAVTQFANARLIASAPTLFDALLSVREFVQDELDNRDCAGGEATDYVNDAKRALEVIDGALAKAMGE